MMPHLERSTYNWNWAKYPKNRKDDQVSPWVEAFVNARLWLQGKTHSHSSEIHSSDDFESSDE
jgi:phosphoribosylformylglycinamidine synthase